MPWNSGYFPASMQNLSAAARHKAIAIANALLAQGMDEGSAIRIAIATARMIETRRRQETDSRP